jgi:hypothetical protein
VRLGGDDAGDDTCDRDGINGDSALELKLSSFLYAISAA